MTQIADLRTSNIKQVPNFSFSIRSGENQEVANYRDTLRSRRRRDSGSSTESTERRFFLTRSGEDDRAKPLQPFGQHLTIPVNPFNSETLCIISREAVVRMTAVSRSCKNQKPL